MNHKTGCLICRKELAYSETLKSIPCFLCKAVHETNATCVDQHYMCDACHRGSANDLIEKYCINTISTDPIALATLLMREPVIKMHGPEHHYLTVPAVLLAAYFNQR